MKRRFLLCIFAAGLLFAAPWQVLQGEQTVFPGNDWATASPASQGVDADGLLRAVAYLEEHSGRDGAHELVVVRNGYLIHAGDRVDKVHGVWSCTKSFTSTVLGLLIDDGKCSMDSPAADWVPAMKTEYGGVTLRHFTTMTSGYRAVGDEPRGGYTHGPSETPLQPSSQPLFTPGSQYAYWDSAMNMFGLVLTRVAEEPLEVLFKRRIADPIGMDPQQWDWGDAATVDGLVVNGGSGNANKHIRISARQFARLGHLFLNDGVWNGQQLVSREWVREATSVHVPPNMPWAHPESDSDGRGVYGCNWWVNGVQTSGNRKWPAAPASTFAAAGHNNNVMFVIPDWNMVVVRLGLDQSDGKITDAVWSQFLGMIGAATASGSPPMATEIKRVLSQQAESWNRGDIDGFMEYYWKSDELTFSSGGQTTRGWSATKENYRRRYPTRQHMGQVTFSELEVFPLGESAALVLGQWRLRRDSEPVGGNFSLVFRLIDRRWLIIHDHTSRGPAETEARP